MPSDQEMITNLIDAYTCLQRIKNSDDLQKELDCQLAITKAKWEVFGIPLENLEIEWLPRTAAKEHVMPVEPLYI